MLLFSGVNQLVVPRRLLRGRHHGGAGESPTIIVIVADARLMCREFGEWWKCLVLCVECEKVQYTTYVPKT